MTVTATQIPLDFDTLKFVYAQHVHGTTSRVYQNSLRTLKLWWDGHSPYWRDVQDRTWEIVGPGWGQPLPVHME